MALRLSAELRNLMLGKKPAITDSDDTELAFVNATAKITDTDDRFLTNFRAGDIISVIGANEATNNVEFSITSIATDGSDMVVDPAPTEDAVPSGPATITLAMSLGLADILRHGVLDIYSGSQPADADTAETGSKLVSITVGSATFTKGTATYGLDFDAPAAGVIAKAAAETWSGVGLIAGTAGWFRFYSNQYITGGSGINIDGAIGTSGAQLNMSNVSIAVGATQTIDTFQLTSPAA